MSHIDGWQDAMEADDTEGAVDTTHMVPPALDEVRGAEGSDQSR